MNLADQPDVPTPPVPQAMPPAWPEAGDGRERLVQAGWRVLDGLSLPRVFAGATTAAIAAEAGVTTGSFFHHFPNATAFADASRCTSWNDPSTNPRRWTGSRTRSSTSTWSS